MNIIFLINVEVMTLSIPKIFLKKKKKKNLYIKDFASYIEVRLAEWSKALGLSSDTLRYARGSNPLLT